MIDTADMDITQMSDMEKLWAYNGLDVGVTLEVLHALRAQIDPVAEATYTFSRSLQGPILEMSARGLRVDLHKRDELVSEGREKIAQLEAQLDTIICDGVGTTLNWRSPTQLKSLLYDMMKLPPVRKRNSNGGFSPTVDRDALEKLQFHFIAQPIIAHILALRDIGKQIGTLVTGIDADGRMRSNFNIAGTVTGRLASSSSDFGTGTNMQNWTKKLREIFIADPGMKFVNIDLEQADARNVGARLYKLYGDSAYLDACESGDLHTTVTRMSRPDLPWTGDPSADRAIADGPGYRHLTCRDLSKKLGHGTNFFGKPPTMAKHSQLPIPVIQEFQERYFGAFPAIPKWHAWVALEIGTTGSLTTLFGRRRYVMGRRNDDSTLREMIAYEPQSMTADEINKAMLRIFRADLAQLMLQVHDSLVLQIPEDREDELIPQLRECFNNPITIRDRQFNVPCDVQTGWNLNEQKENKDGSITNELGLTKYKGGDLRRRPAQLSLEQRLGIG